MLCVGHGEMKDANEQTVAAHVQRNPDTFPQILGGNENGDGRFLVSDNPDDKSDHQQEAVRMRLLWMPFFVVLSPAHPTHLRAKHHTHMGILDIPAQPRLLSRQHPNTRTHTYPLVQAIETLSKAFEILDIDDSGRILCEDFLDVALHMDEPAKKEDIYHTRLAVSHLLSGVHFQTQQVKQAALDLGADSKSTTYRSCCHLHVCVRLMGWRGQILYRHCFLIRVTQSGAAVRSAREKKLVEATIKAVMQVIPDNVDFSINKVLQDMQCTDASADRDDISKLTEAIYQDIASK